MLLLACQGPETHPASDTHQDSLPDEDEDEVVDEVVDEDGDGFSPDPASGPADCDDGDATIHPDAEEVCDGVDNDCDDSIDEGAIDATTFYADTDSDGFGDASATAEGCDAPTEHVSSAGDCDDTDSSINPDAEEVCDGADNDCDGEIDEDSAVDAGTWYADTDSDGFGNPDAVTRSCEAPSGAVTVGDDCDDGESTTNPDAAESCDDGVDNDCDSRMDCEDGECHAEAACVEVDCDDGVDNDENGYTDCDDGDCWVSDDCTTPFTVVLEGGSGAVRRFTAGVGMGASDSVQLYVGSAHGHVYRGGDSPASCDWSRSSARFQVMEYFSSAIISNVDAGSFTIESGCGLSGSDIFQVFPESGHWEYFTFNGSTPPFSRVIAHWGTQTSWSGPSWVYSAMPWYHGLNTTTRSTYVGSSFTHSIQWSSFSFDTESFDRRMP